jgi:8-oxo-dGTP diphosphatase
LASDWRASKADSASCCWLLAILRREQLARSQKLKAFLSMKRVVAALILKDGLILACQRTRHQPMPLKWEFPGGKIEEGEQPRDAMRRELEEELGIVADVGVEVARIVHEYPGGGSVELRFFEVRSYEGEVDNRIFREIRWVTRKELLELDFLEADLGLVKDLAAGKII